MTGIKTTISALIALAILFIGAVFIKIQTAHAPEGTIEKSHDDDVYDSEIHGQVWLDSACPVIPGNEECPPRPYATEVHILRANPERLFTTEQSDEDGSFEVGLPSGVYIIRVGNGVTLPVCPEINLTLAPDAVEEVTILCDSGIR